MNSATSGLKKPLTCRYFLSQGRCFYGDECQFVHASPNANPTLDATTRELHSQDGLDAIVSHNDCLDSLFLAFSGQNGLPQESKLASYMNRPHNAVVNNSVSEKAVFPSNNAIGNHLSTPFAALSLESTSNKAPPNPVANEFIPRSSTPALSTTPTVTQSSSSSSPQFLTYSTNSGIAGSTPFGRLSQGIASFPSGPFTSNNSHQLNGPRITPQDSPMVKRRSRSPNNVSQSTSAASSQNVDPFTYQVGQMCIAGGVGRATVGKENVGGTTYYYTHEDGDFSEETTPTQCEVVMPDFHLYPSNPGHIAHMNPKANAPSFFMPDELRMDILHRHTLLLARVEPGQCPDLPREVDSYHNLVPLEVFPTEASEKSSTFGYVTSVFKATNMKTGLVYCLRRIHGFRLVNTKCMVLVDLWKKLQHSNIVQLREVFTTKAFGEHSFVFVHDYHPGAETMMTQHFGSASNVATTSGTQLNSTESPRSGSFRQTKAGPRQHAGLLPESMIWSYVVQLSSALRTIHAAGLACRTLDPTKILITGKSRLRLNCCGIFDVLGFDPNESNPLVLMPHYQQEDLVALGKIVLALACNSLSGIQRDNIQSSMELVARNYSADLRNLILYLLTNQSRVRSVNDIMPMIGARFYTQLDAAQMRSDVVENELAKEVENGRLFRILSKLGVINERPELSLDQTWSETGDRYMMKLFRDYLFHQVTEHGHPWLDMAHIVQCLNKLDAGVSEKVCLMSRDEQNILVVSYSELKHCFDSSFNEVVQAAAPNSKPAV